jgi:hypothetical protein
MIRLCGPLGAPTQLGWLGAKPHAPVVAVLAPEATREACAFFPSGPLTHGRRLAGEGLPPLWQYFARLSKK